MTNPNLRRRNSNEQGAARGKGVSFVGPEGGGGSGDGEAEEAEEAGDGGGADAAARQQQEEGGSGGGQVLSPDGRRVIDALFDGLASEFHAMVRRFRMCGRHLCGWCGQRARHRQVSRQSPAPLCVCYSLYSGFHMHMVR